MTSAQDTVARFKSGLLAQSSDDGPELNSLVTRRHAILLGQIQGKHVDRLPEEYSNVRRSKLFGEVIIMQYILSGSVSQLKTQLEKEATLWSTAPVKKYSASLFEFFRKNTSVLALSRSNITKLYDQVLEGYDNMASVCNHKTHGMKKDEKFVPSKATEVQEVSQVRSAEMTLVKAMCLQTIDTFFQTYDTMGSVFKDLLQTYVNKTGTTIVAMPDVVSIKRSASEDGLPDSKKPRHDKVIKVD